MVQTVICFSHHSQYCASLRETKEDIHTCILNLDVTRININIKSVLPNVKLNLTPTRNTIPAQTLPFREHATIYTKQRGDRGKFPEFF